MHFLAQLTKGQSIQPEHGDRPSSETGLKEKKMGTWTELGKAACGTPFPLVLCSCYLPSPSPSWGCPMPIHPRTTLHRAWMAGPSRLRFPCGREMALATGNGVRSILWMRLGFLARRIFSWNPKIWTSMVLARVVTCRAS